MIKFLLVIHFEARCMTEDLLSHDEVESIADNYIAKVVEMPIIPRTGEYIRMGDALKVESVYHLTESQIVEVRCAASLGQGINAFAQDKEGWDIKELTSGRELFFQKLKQFEQRRRK